ncbi:hypothetical protein BH09VER1_BH09VER1_14490 [soil metagenome]
MSDNWIIVIPEDPGYVPTEAAMEQAIELFERLAPEADEVNAEASENPRFIDCGANLERISCPDCGADIEVDWWQNKIEEESDEGFPLRSIVLPCCGSERNLNELKYDWPQGFARFSLEAMNPGICDLTDEDLKVFEAVLGSRLRKILQHL